MDNPQVPRDPAMLMSWVNMKLRDDYDGDPDTLCDDLGLDRQELDRTLARAGFVFDPAAKKYW